MAVEANRLFSAALKAHQAKRFEEALGLYGQVIALQPGNADAYGNGGVALRQLGRWRAAVAGHRRAIALDPAKASHRSNLGNVLRDLDRLEESLESHRKAVELDPNGAGGIYNMALVLQDLGRLDEALEGFDRAIAADPNNRQCRWDRSLALLLKGDFQRGFAEYEARWLLPDTPRHGIVGKPEWDGGDLTGRTILLHQEQGFGDAIQFIRYVPVVKAKGARVAVRCHPYLVRLFATAKGIDLLVPKGNPFDDFDVHAPLLSLPRILGTTLDTVPADVPYLRPPAECVVELKPLAGTRLKIGVSWGGSPTHRNDRRRSVPVERFVDLCDRTDVGLYSLQKGDREDELTKACTPILMAGLGPHLRDFADTAAVLAQLDLVITVDTSLAHLAGALGRPCWVLVPFAPDWRWMRGREDSPWYPSLRLFRQPRPGAWDEVFDRVRRELDAYLDGPGGRQKQAAGGQRQITGGPSGA